MTIEVMEFIRRYLDKHRLQHVLPTGFMEIRYYGFLGSGSSVTLDDIRAALELSLDFFIERRQVTKTSEKLSPHCPKLTRTDTTQSLEAVFQTEWIFVAKFCRLAGPVLMWD